MDEKIINGVDLKTMVEKGAKCLSADMERINQLNVFPVPDGDTGTNMVMTIDGGAKINKEENSIGEISKAIARAMVLSARGNSGVILSQFFKGLSIGLDGKEEVTIREFAEAMISGTKKSYSVVSNPTEGTILTVMREAGENAYKDLTNDTTLEQYLVSYLKHANVSLANTPELLPVLKKAGVIDSGGAGFILVIEGMLHAVRGEDVEEKTHLVASSTKIDTSGFNADSELTYGYCTEFILQLQNSKVNVKTFDLDIITNYLNSIGNSVVSFKDDDIVKVHVHTFDPGQVLSECRKYGEFLTIKIENMNVQHSDNEEFQEPEEIAEHKEYAMVAVANGSGIEQSFKDMGVDVVVSGGQTMNTSCQDFIKAFDKINATNIFVYPNNGNILMAAKQAAEDYDKANIVVIPTKTLAQGYSAISMFEYESDDVNQVVEAQMEVISNVNTLEVTYSVRDTMINDIEIKKDDFICLYNNDLVSCDANRIDALKAAINSISDFEDKQVLTVIYGTDVNFKELEELKEFVEELNSFIEVCSIEGKQDIYSYIIGIE